MTEIGSIQSNRNRELLLIENKETTVDKAMGSFLIFIYLNKRYIIYNDLRRPFSNATAGISKQYIICNFFIYNLPRIIYDIFTRNLLTRYYWYGIIPIEKKKRRNYYVPNFCYYLSYCYWYFTSYRTYMWMVLQISCRCCMCGFGFYCWHSSLYLCD